MLCLKLILFLSSILHLPSHVCECQCFRLEGISGIVLGIISIFLYKNYICLKNICCGPLLKALYIDSSYEVFTMYVFL